MTTVVIETDAGLRDAVILPDIPDEIRVC
jgi:hypothetical protein